MADQRISLILYRSGAVEAVDTRAYDETAGSVDLPAFGVVESAELTGPSAAGFILTVRGPVIMVRATPTKAAKAREYALRYRLDRSMSVRLRGQLVFDVDQSLGFSRAGLERGDTLQLFLHTRGPPDATGPPVEVRNLVSVFSDIVGDVDREEAAVYASSARVTLSRAAPSPSPAPQGSPDGTERVVIDGPFQLGPGRTQRTVLEVPVSVGVVPVAVLGLPPAQLPPAGSQLPDLWLHLRGQRGRTFPPVDIDVVGADNHRGGVLRLREPLHGSGTKYLPYHKATHGSVRWEVEAQGAEESRMEDGFSIVEQRHVVRVRIDPADVNQDGQTHDAVHVFLYSEPRSVDRYVNVYVDSVTKGVEEGAAKPAEDDADIAAAVLRDMPDMMYAGAIAPGQRVEAVYVTRRRAEDDGGYSD